MTDPAVEARWRVGRKVGRTIYAEIGDAEAHPLIGVMDTPELAEAAVKAHNERALIRRQAFTEAADAIEARRYGTDALSFPNQMHVSGCRQGRDDAAALVRGLSEGTA